MASFKILKIIPKNDSEVIKILTELWGSTTIISNDQVHKIEELSGFLAIQKSMAAGLVTYIIKDGSCEIVTLNSLMSGLGVGTDLVNRCIKEARENNCTRLWVAVTNDNTEAMKFYQKRGFRFNTVYKDKLAKYRQIKPSIPQTGQHGISLTDEIILDLIL